MSKQPMPADTVPVATLEKLWRRLRRRASRLRLDAVEESIYERGEASGTILAAADLRAIIDAAKGEKR